jgi:hypothetical protein
MEGSAPNWSKIFEKRPDLESPGYRETVEEIRLHKNNIEREKLAAQMRQINKEKQSQRNKNRSRSAAARNSAVPDPVNPVFGVNKRGRKNG